MKMNFRILLLTTIAFGKLELLNRGWISEDQASKLLHHSQSILPFATFFLAHFYLRPEHPILSDFFCSAVFGMLGLQQELSRERKRRYRFSYGFAVFLLVVAPVLDAWFWTHLHHS